MLYSMKNVTELYDLSSTTIKNYCELAKDFLSHHATPMKTNGRRAFTYDDLKIFALIKSAKDYQTAHLALAAGERGEVPALHNEYTITIQQRDQVMLLQNQLINLQAQILEREKELEEERTLRRKAEGKVELLETQLANERKSLDEVKESLVQLKMKLNFEDKS